jgi:hypothetical protein
VDPVPDPLLLRKSDSAGNPTQDLWICSQKLWPLDHRGDHWDRKLGRNLCYSLEYRTMEKVQNPSYSVCYTPSSEPFRIYSMHVVTIRSERRSYLRIQTYSIIRTCRILKAKLYSSFNNSLHCSKRNVICFCKLQSLFLQAFSLIRIQ